LSGTLSFDCLDYEEYVTTASFTWVQVLSVIGSYYCTNTTTLIEKYTQLVGGHFHWWFPNKLCTLSR